MNTESIRVVYSNKTEQLVEALVESLSEREAFQSIFESPVILVPNWNIGRYLQFELSQRFGVAGDPFLTVEEWLQQAAPDNVSFLDNVELRSAILSRLTDDEFLSEDDLRQVSEYLESPSNGNGGRSVALKRYQLAKRMTDNIRQYGHSRVEMIDRWNESDQMYVSEQPYRTNERWQRRLWRSLFDEHGRFLRGEDGADRYLLTEYLRTIDPAELDLPPVADVFGYAHFAPVYGEVFERLGRETQLRFYVLNPCREYWEDVIYDEEDELIDGKNQLSDRREQAAREGSDDVSWNLDLSSSDDPPLALSAWGRATRDYTHMLNTLGGYGFVEAWDDPAEGDSPSLLEQFQSDLLHYRRPDERRESDESIQWLACPGPRREVEIAADEIWSLVSQSDSLNFNDIAVMINPRRREEYQGYVETVFEQVHDIPYNQVDLTRGEGSRMMEGIQRLLKLPAEPVERENVLSVLTHPHFSADLEDVDPDRWTKWVDRLAIYHGADDRDHEETYLRESLFHWDQGLRRLMLGRFMEGRDEDRNRRWFEQDGDRYAPEELNESSAPSAGVLAESSRRLIAAARSVRGRTAPLTEWFDWMTRLVRTHLSPTGEGDEPEYHSYLKTLGSLSELPCGPEEVGYETALEFALDELESQEYQLGHYLSSGVVVSACTPQRPIPFQVVFMLGMNADDFPETSPRSPLDLHTESWEEGDLRQADRERCMFFNALLCARSRVYTSWVARDPKSGEEQEPSSCLREFQTMIEEYVGKETLEGMIRTFPLRRYDFQSEDDDSDQAVSSTVHPQALQEARARRLRENLIDRMGQGSNLELDAGALSEPARELLREVEVPSGDELPVDGQQGAREIQLSDLERFLKSPLQGWARYKLGLTEEDEDDQITSNDEPFETDRMWQAILNRGALEDAVLSEGTIPDPATVEREYEGQLYNLQARGHAPAGVFEDLQRTKDRDRLSGWLAELSKDGPATLNRYRFGSTGDPGHGELRIPHSCTIRRPEGPEQGVDIVGDTQLWDPENNTLYRFSSSSSTPGAPKFLRGYLSGMVLRADGLMERESFRVVIVREDGRSERVFVSGEPDQAHHQLTRWIQLLFAESHDYRLPMDVSESFLEAGGAGAGKSYDLRVREEDDGHYGGTVDQHGPIENPEDYRSPGIDTDNPDQVVEELLRERHRAFWEGYFDAPWQEIVGGSGS